MMDSATVKCWELQHLSNKFASRYNASQILKGGLDFAEDFDLHRFTMGVQKIQYIWKKMSQIHRPCWIWWLRVDSHWRSWLFIATTARESWKVSASRIGIDCWTAQHQKSWIMMNCGTRVCASALSAAKLCPKLLLKHPSASCQQSKESSGEEASLKSHSWKC